MQVSDMGRTLESIMKSPGQPIEARTPVIEALRLSERCGLHHLLLFDGPRPVGVVCTCDLEEIALAAPVGDALHGPPVMLDVKASISDAARCLTEQPATSVLVTREGEAVGIVTREDVLGIDFGDAASLHCETCGSVTHLKRDALRGVLCWDCRSHAMPATPEDELGGSD